MNVCSVHDIATDLPLLWHIPDVNPVITVMVTLGMQASLVGNIKQVPTNGGRCKHLPHPYLPSIPDFPGKSRNCDNSPASRIWTKISRKIHSTTQKVWLREDKVRTNVSEIESESDTP